MAQGKVRNVSGEDRVTGQPPRLVVAGAVFTVPDDDPYGVFGYTQQLEVWEPADADAKRVHEFNLDAIAFLLAEQEVSEEVVEDPDEAAEKLAPELINDVIPHLDREAIAALVEAENERPRGPRKTVIAAIEDRLAELDEPPADGDDASGTNPDGGDAGHTQED